MKLKHNTVSYQEWMVVYGTSKNPAVENIVDSLPISPSELPTAACQRISAVSRHYAESMQHSKTLPLRCFPPDFPLKDMDSRLVVRRSTREVSEATMRTFCSWNGAGSLCISKERMRTDRPLKTCQLCAHVPKLSWCLNMTLGPERWLSTSLYKTIKSKELACAVAGRL